MLQKAFKELAINPSAPTLGMLHRKKKGGGLKAN